MEWVIGIWAILIFVIGLNLSAAGASAILYVWRSKMRYGSRVTAAVVVAAILPASLVVVVGLVEGPWSGDQGLGDAFLAFAMIFLMAAAAASPGALIVASKLDRFGEVHRTFE